MTLQSLSSTFLTSSPSNPILPLVKYTTTGCSGVAGRAWQALRPMLMRCSAVATTPTTTAEDEAPGAARRSANFQPTIWTPDFLESLAASRPPMEEKQWKKAEELEEDVRKMIADPKQPPLAQLIFIDDVERLGLGYRFEDDIVKALGSLTGARVSELMAAKENSLRATALSFRLLREHGFHVSQDEFKRFKDSNNNAFNSTLINDIEGLLDLYEASFFAFRGEDLLEEAREFAITSLTNLLPKITEEGGFIADNVARSLDLALHHRFPRLEARQYIDVYPKKKDSKTVLLELAKVDFDRVQAIHQKDLQEMSRWWTRTALANKLSFARDRLMESFFWAVGMSYEPQNSDCRKAITKAFVFITIIDDIYDVYGSVEELELFTKAVERWDVDAIDDLPDYMQLTFLALYNAVNEEGYEALKQKGVNSIPLFRKAWEDLCKAFLVEAKWCHNAETPPFKEYLDNAWISVSGTVMLVHAYFLVSPEITQEQVDLFYKYHDIVRLPSMIFRLSNDLRTSEAELERGETFKSIPCLMKAGASYDEACKHISNLIDESWKALNEIQVADIPFSKNFIWTAINLGRIAQCTYQYGDGHGAPDDRTKNRVMSLLVEQVQ